MQEEMATQPTRPPKKSPVARASPRVGKHLAAAIEVRGVRLAVLQDIAAKLKAVVDGKRVLHDGRSGIRLENNVFQERKLVDGKIVRAEIMLNDEEWAQAKPACVAVGDRIKGNGAITAVSPRKEYTLLLGNREPFCHASTIVLTDSDFICGKYTRDQGMTTEDAMEEVKAATVNDEISYLEMLVRDRSEQVGTANQFVSHAWASPFHKIIDTLAAHVEDSDYLWFDICCANQHKSGCFDLKTAVQDIIKTIGHTLLILPSWEHPATLTRLWCLWELYLTARTGAKLEVISLKRKEAQYLDFVLNNFKKIIANLRALDMHRAETSNADDRRAICQAVVAAGGFEAANKICRVGIQNGLVECGNEKVVSMKDGKEKWQFMDRLAFLLEGLGKLEESETLYRCALAGNEDTLGPKHPHTLQSANNLAILLQAQGKLVEAGPLYRRALAGNEQIFGSKHSLTVTSINNLATLLQNQGLLEEAESLYRRALEGNEENLGPKHPNTLISVNNLACLLKAQGEVEQVEPLYRRALSTDEEVIEPKQLDTLVSVTNVTFVLQDQGKLDEAESLFRRALSMSEQIHGCSHLQTLNTRGNLGSCLMVKGDEVGRSMVEETFAALKDGLTPYTHPLYKKFSKILSGSTKPYS